MPKQPKETWEEIEAQLLTINQNLQALTSQQDAQPVNKKLLQQVILLAGQVEILNKHLRPR